MREALIKIETQPVFRAAVKKQNMLVFILSFLLFIYYFSFLLMVGYGKDWLSIRLAGRINIGFVFAISQYFFAGLLAFIYTIKMKKIDAMLATVIESCAGNE